MAVAVAKEEMDYTIKPEASAASISTSDWPLLLKNYEQRKCFSGRPGSLVASTRWTISKNI